MATLDETIFTSQGLSLINDLNNDRGFANGFVIYFSTSDLTGMSDDDIRNLTDIQSKDIKETAEVFKLDQGDTKIRAMATYTGNQPGIYIKTYATYSVDKDGHETLFSIYRNSIPQYILNSSDGKDITQGYGFNVGISQTDNISMTKLSNMAATLQDVDNAINKYGVVDITGNQTVTGDKDFTGKLQHNGQNVITQDELNSAISNFSGDDKDHNFTGDLKYKGDEVATSDVIQNAINKKMGDFSEGRSFNELIGQSGTWDINNHNLVNYKDSEGLPNGNQYGAISTFPGTGFTIIFVFLGNGQVFVAPRSQYQLDTPFKRLIDADDNSFKNIADQAYNNAVTTADQHTDAKIANSTPINITSSEQEAIQKANEAVKPALFIYPTDDDANKVTLAKHVLGIYGYGIGNLQPVNLSFTTIDSSKIDTNTAYATYNPNNKIITLHGSVDTRNGSDHNAQLFSMNISNLGKNKITSFDSKGQTLTADTDVLLNNIIISSNGGFLSNNKANWNIDGITIGVDYDASLQPKIPDYLNGYDVRILHDGDDLEKFTTASNTIYYAHSGTQIKNSPYDSSAAFIMQVVTDGNGVYRNTVRIDSGTNGQPFKRGYSYIPIYTLDNGWEHNNYSNGQVYNNGTPVKIINPLFQKFGGGYIVPDWVPNGYLPIEDGTDLDSLKNIGGKYYKIASNDIPWNYGSDFLMNITFGYNDRSRIKQVVKFYKNGKPVESSGNTEFGNRLYDPSDQRWSQWYPDAGGAEF